MVPAILGSRTHKSLESTDGNLAIHNKPIIPFKHTITVHLVSVSGQANMLYPLNPTHFNPVHKFNHTVKFN